MVVAGACGKNGDADDGIEIVSEDESGSKDAIPSDDLEDKDGETLAENNEVTEEQPKAAQQVDVSDLPEDLSDFLLYFNSYRDKSGGMQYDCSYGNGEEFNIVERIIGSPSCVNKALYPGYEETSVWSFETDDLSQWDPLGQWTAVEGYGRISKQYVDFVAANIFHIDNVLLDELRETDIYYCYGDYYYYWFGGMGWLDPIVTVTEAWIYDDCYYLKYTHSGDGYEDIKSHNAVLAWSET